MNQQIKPIVYTFDEICESQDFNHEHEFVDKQAFDRVVEALKFYSEAWTMVKIQDDGRRAREALKEVGEL